MTTKKNHAHKILSYFRFKVYYFDKFYKFVLFLNISTNYFKVSHCIVFLFCIVKWICRNKFIIIIIIIIMYECMYVCIYVCIYVSMYIRMQIERFATQKL